METAPWDGKPCFGMKRGKASQRYSPCRKCGTLIRESDGYYLAVTGLRSRTFVCRDCAGAYVAQRRQDQAAVEAMAVDIFTDF